MAANPQPRHGGDPRVLRVVTRLNVGGPARQALFLSDELRNRGFETRLVWGAAGPDEGTFEPTDLKATLQWAISNLEVSIQESQASTA